MYKTLQNAPSLPSLLTQPNRVGMVLVATSLLMLGMALLAPEAHAGTGGAEYQTLYDTLVGWMTGYLGRVIAVVFIIVGIIAGVGKSIMGFVIGIAAGVGMFLAPDVIDATVSATLPVLAIVPF